jgi:hypothetical protein
VARVQANNGGSDERGALLPFARVESIASKSSFYCKNCLARTRDRVPFVLSCFRPFVLRNPAAVGSSIGILAGAHGLGLGLSGSWPAINTMVGAADGAKAKMEPLGFSFSRGVMEKRGAPGKPVAGGGQP